LDIGWLSFARLATALRVTPMIHVADVRATMEWYTKVGFKVERTNERDGLIDWALLSFGEGRVMFTAGGKLSSEARRGSTCTSTQRTSPKAIDVADDELAHAVERFVNS
jgi:hypothetical protein